jgi:AcrR family transcriptional regulator
MQANNSSNKQKPKEPTFVESARRAQIIDTAIKVIAEIGYSNASFAKIAERAKLSSTGIISYHFSSRAELTREVVAEVMRVAEGHVRPRVNAFTSHSDRLRAFIEANLELTVLYPNHMPALAQIYMDSREGAAAQQSVQTQMQGIMAFQAERMREAQRLGEFREFDADLMVMVIRSAIDTVVLRKIREPELDVVACARELVAIFDLATRKR